jgi:hypothetical protein
MQEKQTLKNKIEKIEKSKIEKSKKPKDNPESKHISSSINDSYSQLSEDKKEEIHEILIPVFQIYENNLQNPENQISDLSNPKSDLFGGEEKENNLNLFGGQQNLNSILFSDETKSQDIETHKNDIDDNITTRNFYEELNKLMKIEDDSKIMNSNSEIQKLEKINNLEIQFYFKILKPCWKPKLSKLNAIAISWSNKYYNTMDQYIRLKKKRERNEIPRTLRIKIPEVRCNYNVADIKNFNSETKELEYKLFDEVLRIKEIEINIIPKLFKNKIDSLIEEIENEIVTASKNCKDSKYNIHHNDILINEISGSDENKIEINLSNCKLFMSNYFSQNAIKIFQETVMKLKSKTLKYRMEIENKIKQRGTALQLIDESINETKIETIHEIIQEAVSKVAESTTSRLLENERRYQNSRYKQKKRYDRKNKSHNNVQNKNQISESVLQQDSKEESLDESKNHNRIRYGNSRNYNKNKMRYQKVERTIYYNNNNRYYKNKNMKYQRVEHNINSNININNNDLESKNENYIDETKINMDFQHCNQDNLYNNKECLQMYPQGLQRIYNHRHHQERKQKQWRVKNQNTINSNTNI